MTIEKIVWYVQHTPHNTNRAVLEQMLKDLIISHGDSDHNAQLKNIVEEISVRNIIISRYDEITKNEINKLYIKPNVIVIKNTGIYKLNDAVING